MGDEVQYTRAQRLALALDRNLSVTAGAGTGKTRVLTGRFVRILEQAREPEALGARQGAPPRRIVAVTFTRKAANEMRERVTLEVTKKVRAAQEAQDAEAYGYWVNVRRELDEATIHTIHGLAARLVRLAALELEVDPKFRVVEGIDARLMVEESVRGVLSDVPEEAKRGLRELYVMRGAHGVRGILRALVGDRVHAEVWARQINTQGVAKTLDWLWDALVPVDDEETSAVHEKVLAIHEDLQRSLKVAPPEEAKAHVLLAALGDCAQAGGSRRARLQAIWGLLDVCTSQEGDWYKAAHHATGPAREWDAMGLSGQSKEFYGRLEAALAPFVGRLEGVPGPADERVLEVLQALARVYLEVVKRYEDHKARRGFLDYHDLEVLARKALDRPGVAELLRRRLRYLLVDEFQDTNENQWAILQALARAPVEEQLGPLRQPVQRERDAESQGAEGGDASTTGSGVSGWASGQELTADEGPVAKTTQPTKRAQRAQRAQQGQSAKRGSNAGSEKNRDAVAPADVEGSGDSSGGDVEDEIEHEIGEGGLRLVELPEGDEEDEADVLGEDRLFIVGDSKQSIYSFRGADVTVYETSRDAVKEANRFHGLDQEDLDLGDLLTDDVGECSDLERQGEVRLDRNFRSLPGVVRFANRFFERLLAPRDPEAGWERFEARPGALLPERKGLAMESDPSSSQALEVGSVRLLVTPYAFERAVERGDLSAQQADRLGHTRYQFARLVQDIRERVQGPETDRYRVSAGDGKKSDGVEASRSAQYRDVAVLLPRKTNLRLLEEQMRAHDVPYVVVGGRGFWSRQEVWDVVNLLAVIAEPRRDVELFSVLRSPFFAWSDEAVALLGSLEGSQLWDRLRRVATGEHAWEPPASFEGVPPAQVWVRLNRWRARSEATSAARLLMEILEESPYMAALAAYEPETTGRLAAQNLEKLVGLVRELEDRRGRSLVPLVRDLLSLADEDAEEAEAVLPGEEEVGVRVMTVHAAKGLEFPVVYVAETHARFQTGFSQDARGLLFARLEGVPCYVFKGRGEDGEEEESFLRKAAQSQATERARSEYKRLLYVAATRAQDHLVFVGCSERLGPRKNRRAPALKPVSQGRSWMEWMERILGLGEAVYEELLLEPGRKRVFSLREGDEEALLEVDVAKVDLPDEQEDATGVEDPPPGPVGEPVRLEASSVTRRRSVVQVSPSTLLSYAECKARFRYRVIDGLTEGWAHGVRSGAPPFGQELGVLVHRALANGATRKRPVPEAVRKRAWALAERHHPQGWPTPQQTVDLLQQHAERAVAAFDGDLEPDAVLVESDVDVEVAKGLRVRGRVDRVHRDHAGRLVVVDLKTDTVEGDEAAHAKRHGHDAQVWLYDEALRRCGHETGPPALVYSSTGNLLRLPRLQDPETPQVPVDPGDPKDSLGGDVITDLAARVERCWDAGDQEDEESRLEALWPRTAKDNKVCQGCGFYRAKGGPCAGVEPDLQTPIR